jgi:hypothetical protein
MRTHALGVLKYRFVEQHQVSKLIQYLKWKPTHTLATDGSNYSDLTKINPLTVKIFDISVNKVTSNFLDIVKNVFEKIDNVLYLYVLFI